MEPDEQNWQSWAEHLAAGDARTVEEFWGRYGARLQGLAAEYMSTRLCRREGPEDVVQSVCRTFLRRAQIGQFRLPDSEQFWRLLCAITITKIRQKARFHQQQKRDFGRERHLASPAGDSTFPCPQIAAPQPTPAEAAEFADQLGQLLAELDDEERPLFELKLEQYTNQEIADKRGCSERTVRRILKRIQSRLKRQLEAECQNA
jgi:RNA polymerase sigma factor (sigma-70 family)